MPAKRLKPKSRGTAERTKLERLVKELTKRVDNLENAVGTGEMMVGEASIYEVLEDLRRRVSELESQASRPAPRSQ